MAYVATWLNEEFQARTADVLVDDTFAFLKKRDRLIDKIAPLKTYSHRKFMNYIVKEVRTIASLIAPGVAPPVTQQGKFERIIAEMFKMGLTYRYDEETQWDMKEAMESAQFMMDGTVQDILDEDGRVIQAGTNNDLAQMLFGSIGRMSMAFVDLVDSLTWRALQYGEINATDARTSVSWTLDFKEPGANYNHFPNPLVGPARWDQYATANGISDLYRAVRTYVRTNGYKPDLTIMADELFQDLMMQETTKQAASSMTVTQVGSVSPEMMVELFRRRGIAPYVEMDERYEVEDSMQRTREMRFHNDNRFTFAKMNMGLRALGPTLESSGVMGLTEMENANAIKAATGIYIVTREIEQFPPVDATQGVGTGIPTFRRPKQLFSQQVKDAA